MYDLTASGWTEGPRRGGRAALSSALSPERGVPPGCPAPYPWDLPPSSVTRLHHCSARMSRAERGVKSESPAFRLPMRTRESMLPRGSLNFPYRQVVGRSERHRDVADSLA